MRDRWVKERAERGRKERERERDERVKVSNRMCTCWSHWERWNDTWPCAVLLQRRREKFPLKGPKLVGYPLHLCCLVIMRWSLSRRRRKKRKDTRWKDWFTLYCILSLSFHPLKYRQVTCHTRFAMHHLTSLEWQRQSNEILFCSHGSQVASCLFTRHQLIHPKRHGRLNW